MPLSEMSLLIVEDDRLAQEQLRQILESEVHQIYQAYDGQEGYELYRHFNPDLILADIRMPVMTGLEMARKIRQEDCRQVIVLLSAHNDRQTLLEAINLPVEGFLNKPILDLPELLKTLQKGAKLARKRKEAIDTKARLRMDRCRQRLRSLYRQANIDPLTGLHNRLFFQKRLKMLLQHNRFATLLFIDVDNLKRINDTYGHLAGDQALQKVAAYLKSILPKGAILARIGGDEFAMVLEGPWEEEKIRTLAESALKGCRSLCLDSGKTPMGIGCSIGISRYPQDAVDPAELLDHADEAMYRVKKKGKGGVHFYTPKE